MRKHWPAGQGHQGQASEGPLNFPWAPSTVSPLGVYVQDGVRSQLESSSWGMFSVMGGHEEKVLPARSVWPVVSGDQEWQPLPECTVQELPQVELIIVPSGHLGKQTTGTEAGAASASHGSAIWASLAPWPGPAHTGTHPAQEARSPMSQRSKAQPLRHPPSVQPRIYSRGVGSGFLMRPLVPTSSRPGSSSEESWTGARRGARVRSLPYAPCHIESSFPALVPSLCLLSPNPPASGLAFGRSAVPESVCQHHGLGPSSRKQVS